MSESSTLPAPSRLEHYKNESKSLLKSVRGTAPEALQRLINWHPRFLNRSPKSILITEVVLADCQLVIARENGSPSWPKFRSTMVELARAADEPLLRFKQAVFDGDATRVSRLLKQYPTLKESIDAPLFHFHAPALVQAASKQNRRLIGVLLKAGANIDARSEWSPGGWGALDQADRATARYLIANGAQITIHAAAKHGLLDHLKAMLAADPSLVNARGGDGATPLHMASTTPVCRILIDAGAELDVRDIDHGSTPAQWSIENPSKVRFLVDNGATPDIFLACALGDRKIAKLALELDGSCLDHRLEYPPFTGGSGGHIYLYMKGLGPTARPLKLAAQSGHQELIEWLLPFASAPARLIYACWTLDDQLIRKVLLEDPDLMATMPIADKGAIADAGWDNRVDVLERMLAAGFDINSQGREGGTPLERAAIRGWPNIVKFLLLHGASLDIRNQYGGKPVGAAQWGKENWNRPEADYDECIRLLEEAEPPEN